MLQLSQDQALSSNPPSLPGFDLDALSSADLEVLHSRIADVRQARRSVPAPALRVAEEQFAASTAQVVPASARTSFTKHRHCMIAISLGSKNSEGARFAAAARWAAANFDSCALLVADNIYRITLQLSQNLAPEAALPAALAEGRRFVEQHREIVARHRGGRCRFEFRMLSEVEQSPDFQPYHAQLQALYRDDERFQGSVRPFAQVYLNRGDKVSCAEELAFKERMAIAYLLEETALFACMVKEGFTVFAYPGSIKALEEIVEGKHPGVPEPLKHMVVAGLRLKRCGPWIADGAASAEAPAEAPAQATECHAVLASLGEAAWARFVAQRGAITAAAGDAIVRRGEPADALYILIEGRVELVGPDANGCARRIALLGAGSLFGEQAFVDSAAHGVGVLAMTDCKAVRITREELVRLQRAEPEIALQLLLDVGRVLSTRLRSQQR